MKVISIVDELPRHPTKEYRNRPASGIRQIIIHNSATKPNSPDGRKDVEAFASYHINVRDWPGIGYDYVIGRDGTVWKTNENKAVNYHAGNANSNSLGICLVGDFDTTTVPSAQWQSALELTRQLMKAYDIQVVKVIGHREVQGASTNCPGLKFSMDLFRKELKA